jgi:hypothetical protein
MFLAFIDDCTVWHLKMLLFFSDPTSWIQTNDVRVPNMSMGGRGTLLEHAFPELRGRRSFYDQVWKDLYQRGMVNSDNLHLSP